VSSVSLQRSGTDGYDSLLGGPESTTLRGLVGNDVMVGGPGDDKLDGGVGDDTLYGGTGRDSLDGGPGADRIVDRSGPTVVRTGTAGSTEDYVNVRDGRGDDIVKCSTRRSVVAADPGDRVSGLCGTVVRKGAVPSADPQRRRVGVPALRG